MRRSQAALLTTAIWLVWPAVLHADEAVPAKPFPAEIPLEKPTDRPLSAAVARMYDVWNPYEDRGNELFSNFKHSRIEGLSREANVSRRDPSKVLKIDGTYYVWYTCRRTVAPPGVAPLRPADHDTGEGDRVTVGDELGFPGEACQSAPVLGWSIVTRNW